MRLQPLTLRRVPRLARLLALLLAATVSAAAQTPDGSSAGGIIRGPAPPDPPAVAARDAQGRVTLRATRLTGPLALDGRLDEAIYRDVLSVSGFIQQEPIGGDRATEWTEVWVCFDQRTGVFFQANPLGGLRERLVVKYTRLFRF